MREKDGGGLEQANLQALRHAGKGSELIHSRTQSSPVPKTTKWRMGTSNPEDHTSPTYDMIPGFTPWEN